LKERRCVGIGRVTEGRVVGATAARTERRALPRCGIWRVRRKSLERRASGFDRGVVAGEEGEEK